MDTHATDPANQRNKPPVNEFKIARQLTRHSASEVAQTLGVSRSTVSRWESGELTAPSDVIEWLQINRNQYASNVRPLFPKGGKRGADLRPVREAIAYPLTSVVAKAAERA